jgi:phage gp45-like
MRDFEVDNSITQGAYRMQSVIGRATLKLGDDTDATQTWQIEGYPGEIRSGVQRLGQVGLATMPLPGAKAHVSWQGGSRGFGTITNVEDPRYRPKELKGGEFLLYAVTGADEKGEGGAMKPILKGTVNGEGHLTGLKVFIGDADTTDVNIVASSKVTLKAPEVDISNGGTVQAVKLADGTNSTVLKAQ